LNTPFNPSSSARANKDTHMFIDIYQLLMPHQWVLLELGQPGSKVSACIPHQLTQQSAKRTSGVSTRSTTLPAAAAAAAAAAL
jgi:hypothetical protein